MKKFRISETPPLPLVKGRLEALLGAVVGEVMKEERRERSMR